MSVNRKYEVEINSQGFALKYPAENYKMTYEQAFVPQTALPTTEGEEPASNFWWIKRHSDFAGGYDQLYAEAKNAQTNRFLDSENIDNSTPGRIKLQLGMTTSLSKAGTNGILYAALGKLWLADGTNVYYYDGSSWSAAVATGVTGNIAAITDDGANLIVFGTSGVIRKGSTGAYSDYNTNTGFGSRSLGFINGDLYSAGVGATARLSKVDSGGSGFTVMIDVGTSWVLNSLTEHNQKIVAGGYRGLGGDEKSYVWESDGTASGTSILIDDLPKGFKIFGLLSYSDILWIYGGWELVGGSTAEAGLYSFSNNVLRLVGKFKETAHRGLPYASAVPTIDMIPRAAFATGQFMYFGMNEKTGLWRYDLKEGGLSPSWSAASGDNQVTGTALYKGKIYVAYSGAGAFVQDTSYQSSGWIKTSVTTLDHSNKKIGRKIIVSGDFSTTPDVNYDGSALPTAASPVWTKLSAGSPTESSSGGILTTAGTTTSVQRYTIADAAVSDTTGATVEAKIKIITAETDYTTASPSAGLAIDGGAETFYLAIFDGWIRAHGELGGSSTVGQYFMDTTDGYHVYRFTAIDGNLKVYVDGTLRISVSAATASSIAQGIFFGDFNGVSTINHEEKWDFVRYWTNGAFVPGDERPSTNPFIVEVSKDEGTTFTPLTEVGDSGYKDYDLKDYGLWDSLIVKLTITNSNVIVNDISIEGVPVIPDSRVWSLIVDIWGEIDTLTGDSQVVNAQEIWEALEAAKTTKAPVSYRDVDYDKQTTKKTYSVLIEALSREKVYIDEDTHEQLVKIKLRQF